MRAPRLAGRLPAFLPPTSSQPLDVCLRNPNYCPRKIRVTIFPTFHRPTTDGVPACQASFKAVGPVEQRRCLHFGAYARSFFWDVRPRALSWEVAAGPQGPGDRSAQAPERGAGSLGEGSCCGTSR